ncbi:uncharacterized protein BCR38DRAFT_452925 [Pseudomassariella vexata]|uniref:PLL-like beta propeller domain-containing protein n=1 Tax=Pseudomassariella vexata TaxID=1141098 RepID=A0A1Y2D774_9PEZI|nr:uncharacterized protein BCR38DRAFT_452925 [Pseudomassariella vexata]ORY55129.1 hypothetical protein BCR38DRAFT_452925 [Pseudomassariella vexata]
MDSTNSAYSNDPEVMSPPTTGDYDRPIYQDAAKVLVSWDHQHKASGSNVRSHAQHATTPSPKAIRPDPRSRYGDAPEVTVTQPQSGPHGYYPVYQYSDAPQLLQSLIPGTVASSSYESNGPEVVSLDGHSGSTLLGSQGLEQPDPLSLKESAPIQVHSSWFRWRNKWIVVGLVTFIIVVALVIGLVVGLKHTTQTTQTQPVGVPANNTSPANIKCKGTICRQIFSAAALMGDRYVFGIGNDQSMWYTRTVAGNWTNQWSSLGNQFQGQPSSVVWNSSGALSLFAVSSAGGVVAKSLTDEGNPNPSESEWANLNAAAGSAIGACHSTYGIDRADIWMVSKDATSRGVTHNYWDFEGGGWAGNLYRWDTTVAENPAKGSGATPAVVCRDDNMMHDIVIYDKDTSTVLHRQYAKSRNAWEDWNDRGGSFVGDPVVIAPSNDRIDFFGIGAVDKDMRHFSWTSSSNYSDMEHLGGSWASVPSVVASGDDRLDVVAVGTDGKVKHRAFYGQIWSADWLDLGDVVANSAPLIVNLDPNEQPARLGVFALGTGGDLLYSSWQTRTTDPGILEINAFRSIGGNLTSSWMKT